MGGNERERERESDRKRKFKVFAILPKAMKKRM